MSPDLYSLQENLALPSGEAPLLDQGSLYLLLERVGVLANFQVVYAELAASCSAMAAAVASFHDPKQVHLQSAFTVFNTAMYGAYGCRFSILIYCDFVIVCFAYACVQKNINKV